MQRTTIDMLLGRLDAAPSSEGATQDVLAAELQRCWERVPGVRALCVSTADGRALAERLDGGADARRIAAMANSFLTLGETLAREIELSQADYATVCTARGNLVLFRIHAAKPLTLLAMAGPDTLLAALLVGARDCAARIGAALSEPRTAALAER
ncbi:MULTISPECIES: roadblock/LC7 domain-containing protein [Lysobacter]|uniref:Roadblock/LC7 domain family n=2 Tax=Lysobacter TaxID=68 RepID=A0A0S2DC51_LYSEN|nr:MULTISPECIES: roadblock/LC7 domain-containing protein [Lysobacter]ALN55965.1 roadblock/LC7 domain family [Lysobacter enzymogenes]QCW24912.1 roadblock/LC7 domain-containing protein [Lysobacter enzymogenes]QQQ00624.1 roadblock/LC7 domain-containing protein [Lysobacter enzymogenes]WMT03907.1 roadblock/LC7 domain-containing protein [Lysobacter yananisis]